MKKKHIILIACLAVLAIQVFIGLQIQPDMSGIGQAPHKMHSFLGMEIPFGGINTTTVWVTWAIMFLLIFAGLKTTSNLKKVPGRLQALMELFTEAFAKICSDTLGDKGKIFMPYVSTLFLFILLSNWTGILPAFPFHIEIEEPTRDLNTTLGLGIISFLVSHLAAIKYRGIKSYIASYFDPWIEVGGFKIPNVAFMPLNVVGELGKMVSHSFRLYGNILGGAIIIQVISNLTRYIALPIGLNFFFGLFVGAVQAFVFAMLALTYIAVLVEE